MTDDDQAFRSDSGVCPCGSETPADDCCLAIIQGRRPARTAEQLMRSRYTAYVRGDGAYLLHSWHPDFHASLTPEDLADQARAVRWQRLEILRARGGPNDRRGKVEFKAWFVDADGESALHERSRFERINGRWFYTRADKE